MRHYEKKIDFDSVPICLNCTEARCLLENRKGGSPYCSIIRQKLKKLKKWREERKTAKEKRGVIQCK